MSETKTSVQPNSRSVSASGPVWSSKRCMSDTSRECDSATGPSGYRKTRSTPPNFRLADVCTLKTSLVARGTHDRAR